MKKPLQQLEALQNGTPIKELAYDDRISPEEALRRKRQGEKVKHHWQDPAYRAHMLEKQRGLGFRNYPEKV